MEQKEAMEKNLVSMAREIEKLRAEKMNTERRSWGLGNLSSLSTLYCYVYCYSTLVVIITIIISVPGFIRWESFSLNLLLCFYINRWWGLWNVEWKS